MAASSAAAADPRPRKHDVFISFRGKDTREGFTSHLYKALRQKEITAYIDEVSLEKGDTISRALPEAIKESEISIIVFSENYGESRWCLDELVHILKRREGEGQIVLPIFYNIDPSHIRYQKKTYGTAFAKHENRFKDKMEKVREWRQALEVAADLSGWDSRGKTESEIVEEVVKRVGTELDTIMSKRSDHLKGLVGIQERLEKIRSYLDSPAVRVGIWGMGGVGKTTLAKVVFDWYYNDFEGSYFAHDVRENAINKGLATLRKEVYSELLGDEKLDTSQTSVVNHKLSRKRILLVLDDVSDPDQFEDLVGDPYQFSPGSKIIVTSRDKVKVDEEYKVEELDSKDARKLFYLKAFGDESCRRGFEGISDRVVEFTKGLPLALKVLGGSVFYFRKTIKDWEKEVEKLERVRNEKIQKVLEISYDALDAEEKELFLDIACFFKGERRYIVEGILEDKPIAGLVNKSLITIDRDGKIQMHYLMQEMGRDIVRSTKKLGERSRLWIAKDVADVLENNEGTRAIEGIYLPWIEKDDVHLRPDVFEKMRKLRLLKFYDPSDYYIWYEKVKVCIDGDLNYLPNGLRYLHWEYYPGKSLPSNFKPQNLVELHMPNSKLEQLWDGVQELWSLKHINLLNSRLLTKIPDLSRAPNLESINLSCCTRLIHIPSLNLQASVDESAYRHQWLSVELANRHQWPSVELALFKYKAERTPPGCIILHGCLGLTTLAKVGGNIRKLVLSATELKVLPSSIESLENLLHLDLKRCSKLRSLPKFPRSIEVLLLDFSGIEQIPSLLIECLCSLRILSLINCASLSSLPSNINLLTALEELYLIRTSIQALPSTTGMLYKLKKLDISCCDGLQSLPASIGMLYKLKKLDISYCHDLQSLPELPLFIQSVNARGCSSLEMVSTSRSTLTLGRWLDKYDSDWLDEYGSDCDSDGDRDHFEREFLFVNCTKLGEDAINNIFTEFLYKVFCTATTPRKVVVSKRVTGRVVVCYPTMEIPRWFSYQFEGSSITSITITLPPNWYNPKTFLGFVVYVIFAKVGRDFDPLKRKLHLETYCFESRKEVVFEYATFYGYSKAYFENDADCSDHIVMWYEYFDHSKANFEKYQKASFKFKTNDLNVKGCGVRMLYLKDAVEESDDGSTANYESWITDVIDSDKDYATTYDSDEPPPKRTRNL